MTCELFCKCSYTCSESLVDDYCRNNPMLCARRRVAITVGCENVPTDLLPSQSHRVMDAVFAGIEKQAGCGCSG